MTTLEHFHPGDAAANGVSSTFTYIVASCVEEKLRRFIGRVLRWVI